MNTMFPDRADARFPGAGRRKFAFLAGCSLLTLSIAAPAWALDVDDDTTTPVTSSTADDGAPGDVTITDDGEIDISGQDGATAVTVDSDNSVTNEGSILSEDTDNTTGIHVLADTVGSITNNGTIYLNEDYTRTDDDDDDDVDGPLAIGANRTAILVDSGGTLTGDITLGVGSAILVEGNDSAGIVVGSALDGSFKSDGSISVTGDNALALSFEESVSGDILISGSVSARGENATGLVVGGDVGGTLTIDSSVSSTGFTSTGQTNYIAPSYVDEDTDPVEDRLDEDDLYDNTGTVFINGSVDGGILINGAVDDFYSDEDDEDEDKDTLDDFDENRASASIYSYGSGAALTIQATESGEDLVIGTVTETVRDTLDDDDDDDVTETLAVFDLEQGLINRGTILASGINIGFDATALDISGLADGTANVVIEGGMANSGTIRATAYEADSVAVQLGQGALVGTLENTGTITATTATTAANSAVALDIQDGASLTELTNDGTISGSSTGYGGQVTAIRDSSDTLHTITNTGAISASLSADGEGNDGTGTAYALDLSSQTTGTTIVQYERTAVEDINGDDEIDQDDITDPYIVGDILFGSGDDVLQILGGTLSGDIKFGAGSAEYVISDATTAGTITIGGDQFSISLDGGSQYGSILLGSATGVLELANDSFLQGNLINKAGSDVELLISQSEVMFGEYTGFYGSSLSVTGDSLLTFSIDPAEARDTAYLNVDGQALVGSGTTIRPYLTSIVSSDFTVDLIEAGELSFDGGLETITTDALPWIYNVDLITEDADRDTLSLDFRLKTADELGLDINQASAYDAVLAVAVADDEFGTALGAITESDDFQQAYNLLLPQRNDASTRFLDSQFNSAYGALSDHLALARLAPGEATSFWLEETVSQIDAPSDTDIPGYNGRGFGLALGADWPVMGLDSVGVMLTVSDGRFEEKTGGLNPVSTSALGFGGYVAEAVGPLNVELAGQYAVVGFSSDRKIALPEYDTTVSAHWDGTALSSTARVSSDFGSGLIRLTPRVGLDYLRLDQDGYEETSTEALNLEVSDVQTDRFTASAGLGVAAVWNWAPDAYGVIGAPSGYAQQSPTLIRLGADIGYRSVLSSTAYSADMNFVGYDDVFNLSAMESASDAVTASLSFTTVSDLLSARLGFGAEVSDEATALTAGATLRFRF